MLASVDKMGATYFLNQNSREPVTEPDELITSGRFSIWWEPIGLTAAPVGAEKTIACSGRRRLWEKVTRQTAEQADKLECKYYISTECGHVTYSLWESMQKFKIPHKFELVPMVLLYASG